MVKDSNSTEYTVVFTPLDEVNYNSVETRVTLTVNKVKNPPNMPDSTVNVPYSSKVVDDITLPDGWIWQEADKNVVLEPEIPVGAIAVYTGIDKDNYENVSVEIIITRAECVHVTGEILFTGDGDKAPDCVDAGLGHKECTKCGKTVESGIVTDALGHELSKIEKVEATCTKTGSKEYWHCVVCEKKFSDDQGSKEITDMKVLEIPMEAHTGGTATCTTKAICDVCKKEYGELNISNHGEREVKNRKTATCKAPGYTGDTYCKECDTKIVSGEVIEKLTTHSWDAGKVTKEATCTEKGEITYACTDCGETTTEEIPALSAPKKNAILTDAKNAAKYKVTKAGIQNGTLQYVEPMNKNAKAVRIPVTVTIDGIKYKVTSIAKNAFKNNKRLTEVTIGDNVNIIGTNAFYGCTKLKTVITSKNVTTIGENAFYKCTALEKITISSKVTKIGSNAFYGCKKLKIITIKTKKLTTKNVGSNAFKGIYKKAVIKAPKMKVKAYKTNFKKKGMETMIFRYI